MLDFESVISNLLGSKHGTTFPQKISDMAATVIETMVKLNCKKCVLVGHSYGCLIAVSETPY